MVDSAGERVEGRNGVFPAGGEEASKALLRGGSQYLKPVVWMQFAGLLCFAAALLVLTVLARHGAQRPAT